MIASQSADIGFISMSIASFIQLLDSPGAGMFIGFGTAWFVFSKVCSNCKERSRK